MVIEKWLVLAPNPDVPRGFGHPSWIYLGGFNVLCIPETTCSLASNYNVYGRPTNFEPKGEKWTILSS